MKKKEFSILLDIPEDESSIHLNALKEDIIEKYVFYVLSSLKKNSPKDHIRVANFNVLFCSDFFMQTLNKKHLNKDKTTDVLSFPFYEKDILGDIAISFEQILCQSIELKTSYEERLIELLIHGLLHLLGYEHENSSEKAVEMFTLQDKILSEVIDNIL